MRFSWNSVPSRLLAPPCPSSFGGDDRPRVLPMASCNIRLVPGGVEIIAANCVGIIGVGGVAPPGGAAAPPMIVIGKAGAGHGAGGPPGAAIAPSHGSSNECFACAQNEHTSATMHGGRAECGRCLQQRFELAAAETSTKHDHAPEVPGHDHCNHCHNCYKHAETVRSLTVTVARVPPTCYYYRRSVVR